MKLLNVLAVIMMISATGCAVAEKPADDNEAPTTPTDPGTGIVNKSIKLNDADNNFIGYVTSADDYKLWVFTSKGYMCRLAWDGSVGNNYFRYTEADGKGTIFVTEETLSFLAKNIYYNYFDKKYYIPAEENSSGFVVSDSTIKESKSRVYEDAVIKNETSQLYDNQIAIRIKEITRAEVGLPETIKLPLKLKFE